MTRRFWITVSVVLVTLSFAGTGWADTDNTGGIGPEGEQISFKAWVERLWPQAKARGVTRKVFDAAFKGVKPDPRVEKADSNQAEFVKPVWDYLDRAVSTRRIKTGRVKLRKYNSKLRRIERKFGVDRHVLVAIWGIPQECGQPWQQVVGNAGEAHITGLNVELDYAINENWVFGGNFEKMEAETDTNHDLTGDGEFNLVAGLRLPIVPSYKASAWLEYSSPTNLFGAQDWYFRTQWSYTGDSFNILEPIELTDANPQFKNPSYTIGDIRVGLMGEDWEAALFINNVTDERAQYTVGTGQMEWAAAQTIEGRAHHSSVYTNRPTEIGVRFMKRWGD